jgi:hypothetical protein
MDITVLIPSRGRVRGLEAVLYSLRYLESWKHRIHYGVICDDDDIATIVCCQKLKEVMPLAYRIGSRQETMGASINDMAKFMPADVYLVINDDILCLSPDWDKVISEAVEKTPHGIFWWKNACPMDALYPIVTEKWRQAAGGIFSENFPFWYDDLCLVELWAMTTQTDQLRLDISIADKPIKTQRMRDLKFWQKVYTETRKQRVKQSIEIAEKLGLPKPTIGEALAERLTAALVSMDDERLTQIEKNQGETSEPDSAYLRAKEKAQRLLDQLEAA